MADNILECLRQGNVDLVYHATLHDKERMIMLVRESRNRIDIINGFLDKLKLKMPYFCFDIIYDIPEYADAAYELFDLKNMTPLKLSNMLDNSSLGPKILYELLDYFLCSEEDSYLNVIFKYAIDNDNNLLHELSIYSNLHVRFCFMSYLIKHHPEMIDKVYNDITMYTTSVTYQPLEQLTYLPKLMNEKEVSDLAVQLLLANREEDFYKLKEYILKEYKYNHLSSRLSSTEWIDGDDGLIRYSDKVKNKLKESKIKEDVNRLFDTSADYRFPLYLKYKDLINKDLVDNFTSRIKYFLPIDGSELQPNSWGSIFEQQHLYYVYFYELGNLLEEWAEKYMDLSESKEYGFIGKGTTCKCYRIGDYVVKLAISKWSYEDVICPNLYLIAKNYEEKYVRDKDGIVKCGLEVQKYLTRSAKDIDPKYFGYFDSALDRLGYRRTDTLIGGRCGENTMLLDTYKDADIEDPEKVPVWFKKYPLVLIDRDRIYPKDKEFIRQLGSGY